jgi:DNA-binding protein Fis
MAYLISRTSNTIELIPREGGRVQTREGDALWILVKREDPDKVYLFDPHGKRFLVDGQEVVKKTPMEDFATITTPAGNVYEFHRGIPQPAGSSRKDPGAAVCTTQELLAEVARHNPRLELISYLVGFTAEPVPNYRSLFERLCEVTPAARGILALFQPEPEPLFVYNWKWEIFTAKYHDCFPELREGRIVSTPDAMLLPIGNGKGFLAFESTQPLDAEDHYYFHLVASVISASLENQDRLHRLSEKDAELFEKKPVPIPSEIERRAWEIYGVKITIAEETKSVLETYPWQNFQELDETVHFMIRALEEKHASKVLLEHLPQRIQATAARSLEQIEKEHILRILKQTGGERSKAATILGISRKTLYTKLGQCEEEEKT